MTAKKSLEKMLTSMKETDYIPVESNSSGKYSFGVVYSKSNSKRLSFSKSLSDALELSDQIYLLPVPADGVVLAARERFSDLCSKGSLSGSEKKISYFAAMAAKIIELFELDYSNKVSQSFCDIEIDKLGDLPVAVIHIIDKDDTQEEEE